MNGYAVYNTSTGAFADVISDTPYELAGPLAERRYEQKKDEQGNLLFLSATEIMDDEGNPTGEFAEATETGYYIEVVDGYDEENQPTGFHQEFIPYTPVIVDAGAVYEWREILPTLDDLRQSVLRNIDAWTRHAIIGGFVSSANGSPHRYDSEDNDQDNLKLMQAVAHSERFPTHPIYQGHIPIRAIPQGQSEKAVLYLDTNQMDLLLEDLALHIGACKVEGWRLQGLAAAAKTVEALEEIAWEGE